MTVIRRIKQLGPVLAIRRERYRRRFESANGYAMSSGVFRTFEEAAASVRKSGGFNQASLASAYEERLDRVFPYDYPFLFWLQQIFEGAKSIGLLDIGGNVGVHYYAYSKFLRFPPRLSWRVSEVDEIAKAGRARAERVGAEGLEFTTSFEDLDSRPADIILSAGALQYIEQPLLWDVLACANSKPGHILLNKIPLYQGEDFVSLQNIGPGFSPLYVWNRREFVQRFERLGYRLVDGWRVMEREFTIFNDPIRSFGPFSGLYLRRDSAK